MSEETIILTWFGVVTPIGLNGFAAGLAAAFHAWRAKMRRGSRILAAAALSGLLPASLVIAMGFTTPQFVGGDGPLIATVVFAVFWGVGLVVSFPGAWVMARKLEAPSEEFRTFE